ncbi:MAG: radical SAM protein [Sedimentisphaerales bacterium]|jgi:wyosine [tRNA(Phe)-imidazoG37] synthetase (radical SAM superfamily)|nr:radical SAM protein [Sedimentisphaerales bacterium]
MMAPHQYIFGPVASRRLGRSLGVDIVPAKYCTLDCIFCEVGRTTVKTTERRPYVLPGQIIQELQARLKDLPQPDYITITGSGEPTLNSGLGRIITQIRAVSSTPIALLTNGTLLYRPDVRQDACQADVVLPTLDAPDQQTFELIHRPDPSITLQMVVDGLIEFRRQYHGQIWLEVFVVDQVNTDPRKVESLKAMIDRIRPDKIHLNTAVRPTAEPAVPVPSLSTLRRIAATLGPACELIVDPGDLRAYQAYQKGLDDKSILALLQRRPSTLDQLANGLAAPASQVQAAIDRLLKSGQITAETWTDQVFYRLAQQGPSQT